MRESLKRGQSKMYVFCRAKKGVCDFVIFSFSSCWEQRKSFDCPAPQPPGGYFKSLCLPPKVKEESCVLMETVSGGLITKASACISMQFCHEKKERKSSFQLEEDKC